MCNGLYTVQNSCSCDRSYKTVRDLWSSQRYSCMCLERADSSNNSGASMFRAKEALWSSSGRWPPRWSHRRSHVYPPTKLTYPTAEHSQTATHRVWTQHSSSFNSTSPDAVPVHVSMSVKLLKYKGCSVLVVVVIRYITVFKHSHTHVVCLNKYHLKNYRYKINTRYLFIQHLHVYATKLCWVLPLLIFKHYQYSATCLF
jgi:hypothetical protein